MPCSATPASAPAMTSDPKRPATHRPCRRQRGAEAWEMRSRSPGCDRRTSTTETLQPWIRVGPVRRHLLPRSRSSGHPRILDEPVAQVPAMPRARAGPAGAHRRASWLRSTPIELFCDVTIAGRTAVRLLVRMGWSSRSARGRTSELVGRRIGGLTVDPDGHGMGCRWSLSGVWSARRQ